MSIHHGAPMSEKPEAQYVRPKTARVKVTVHTPGISIKTHLWMYWARIAIRAEQRAKDARKLATDPDRHDATHSASETEEGIVAITAVGNLFYNLERVWSPMLPCTKTECLPLAVTTDQPDNAQEWLASIGSLIRTRGNAVHFTEESKPVQPHPTGTHTSPENVTYSVEGATAAVELMMDVLARAIESPSEALEDWASTLRRVLADLRELKR